MVAMVSALGALSRTGYCRFYRQKCAFQQGENSKVALFLYNCVVRPSVRLLKMASTRTFHIAIKGGSFAGPRTIGFAFDCLTA